MNILLAILTYAGIFFALVAVHELGHYLAGWAAGIRAQDMRLRLLTFPQHVALRVGDRWVSPLQFEEFAPAIWSRLVTPGRVYLFVCGGLLVETLFTVAVTAAFVQSGWRFWGFAVALSSLILYASNVLFSMLDTWRRGVIGGDVPGLWALAKVPTVILTLALLAIRLLMLSSAKP